MAGRKALLQKGVDPAGPTKRRLATEPVSRRGAGIARLEVLPLRDDCERAMRNSSRRKKLRPVEQFQGRIKPGRHVVEEFVRIDCGHTLHSRELVHQRIAVDIHRGIWATRGRSRMPGRWADAIRDCIGGRHQGRPYPGSLSERCVQIQDSPQARCPSWRVGQAVDAVGKIDGPTAPAASGTMKNGRTDDQSPVCPANPFGRAAIRNTRIRPPTLWHDSNPAENGVSKWLRKVAHAWSADRRNMKAPPASFSLGVHPRRNRTRNPPEFSGDCLRGRASLDQA